MSTANEEKEVTRVELQQQQQQQQVQVEENCCNNSNNNKKFYCVLIRMLQLYFEPVCSKITYSKNTLIYHLINFVFAFIAYIIENMGLSLSLLLLLVAIGLILYYLICELALVMARFDLWIAFEMVENDELLLKNRPASLQVSLIDQMIPCSTCCKLFFCGPWCKERVRVPDNKNENNDDKPNNNNDEKNLTFCGSYYKRFRTLFLSWRMLLIHGYFLFIKPLVVFLTSWTVLLIVYVIYLFIIPGWYFANFEAFHEGKVCPLAYRSCNENNECHCHGIQIHSYGMAIFCFVLAVFLFPLVFRINNYSAKISKTITYYCVTQYYKYGCCFQFNGQQQQLLSYENII